MARIPGLMASHHDPVRYQKRREMVNAIKLDAGCADCGYDQHPVALDFDHLPQHKKSFDISRSLTIAWTRILAEIAKCDVVCANCHRIRTYERSSVVN